MKNILLAVSLTALTTSAFAADLKPYIEGAVGWADAKDTSSSTINTKFDSDVNYAAEIGLKDIAGTGIRLGGSYSQNELDYKATRIATGAVLETSASKAKTYLLNAYYDFKTGTALTPFVGFGLGMQDTAGAKDNEFVYGMHGGAKYNITNNVYVGAKGSFLRANGITDATSNAKYSDHNQYSINATLGYEF
jgi:opacity protein-like surface antigen